MAVSSRDKVLMGAALVLALASAGVFGTLAIRHRAAPGGPPPQVTLSTDPYVPNAPDAPPIKTETWGAPVAQKRGRDWIYDTFTPPEIFYNARSKQFTVKPPSSLVDEDQQEAFGLELIAVHPEPFRLQLIGFVGDQGKSRGMFQNVGSGEVFLGSTGQRVPNLALTIREFAVASQDIRVGDSMTTKQRVATAVIRDDKSNRDVTLTHRDRVFTGTLFAFVAAEGETAVREVRMGDVFKWGDATYRVDRIMAEPPTVEVTKESPALTQPEQRLLTPREPELADAPDGKGG